MAFAGHRFAVEVGVGDGFDYRTAVIGYVVEPYNISHIDNTCNQLLMRFSLFSKIILELGVSFDFSILL